MGQPQQGDKRKNPGKRKYKLSKVTVITALGFILLAILLALGEILDIPSIVLNAPSTPINWHEMIIELLYLCIIAAFVLLSLYKLDIARMKADKKLDAERRYTRGLFEASLDPLLTFDENGIITDVNEATVKATGCCRDELVGTPFREYFTDSEKAQKSVDMVFAKGAVTDYELIMKSRTGKKIIVSYNATVFHNEDGEMVGVFAAARDITARKKAEEALHEKEMESLHLSRLSTIGEMATGMAHEINQPLTIISASAEGVLRDIKKKRFEMGLLPGDMEDILNSVKRIDWIITHMRTFARRPEEWKYVKPKELLDNAFTILGEELRVHNISISREIEDNLPAVEAEPNQVEQVFINLLTNARQILDEKSEEAEKKGRSFSKQIICKISKDDSDVVFEFADNACGVPDEIKERVFDPFFTTKEVGKGTGMGLSIAYGIVTKSLNGNIWVEDNEMGGASFKVALPIKRIRIKKNKHGDGL